MEKKELLKNIITTFQNEPLPMIIEREVELPIDSNGIISVIGSRRSGKTYLVLETIRKLTQKGVPMEKVLYINFEDERLMDLQTSDLDLILQAYREIYPDNKLSEVYIFLDEVQNITGWQKFVRRIHESVSKKVYITGSNSKLLSTEIATELGGRTLTFEVFPLSFKEFLKFKNISTDLKALYASSVKARVMNGLEEYLIYGGFPEVVERQTNLKNKTLQEYLNVMISNDLVRRYDIKNLKSISFFVKQLINSNTKEVSINKIYNSFKSIGLKIGKNTLYDYFEYAQTIYLAFVLNKYVISDRLREQTSRKVYAIDSGLYNSVNVKNFDDKSKLLENVIFLHLYKKTKEVFFYKDEYHECDFIICKSGKPVDAIQVCYSFESDDTRKREVSGLVKACHALNIREGKIIKFESSESIFNIDGIKISILSAPEYLLTDPFLKPFL